MRKVIIFSMIAVLISLAACTTATASGVLKSDKARQVISGMPDSDRTALIEGNGAFAFDLYRQLKDKHSNLFFSPYSISAALAMTYAGASGTTKEQMAQALHFDLSQDKLHPAFNWLEQELSGRDEGKDAEAFRLNIVNAIWGQKNYKFKQAFLDTLAENYGTGLRIADFISNPDKSRLSINNWVSEQTEGKIIDILQLQNITADSRLVLTNAIYFKAAWQHKFMQENTQILPFHLLDGNSVSVPMMKQTMVFGHSEGDNYQAVDLPYKGNKIAMLILLPEQGKFANFEDSLDYQRLSDIIAGMEKGNVHLTLPKFQFESAFRLKETLSALGMAEAFNPDKADFSGMTDIEKIWIDDVTHKACVSVDENGTEAAAATVATMVASLPGTITINRPFIFLIRDIETGSILFIGRILNPAEGTPVSLLQQAS